MLITDIVLNLVKKNIYFLHNFGIDFQRWCFSEIQASILKSVAIKDTTAPIVASFSSRGPNSIVADILKVRPQLPAYLLVAYHSSNAKYI